MECKDVAVWLDAAKTLGLPTLALLLAAFKGKDWLEGFAAIISAVRGTWTKKDA